MSDACYYNLESWTQTPSLGGQVFLLVVINKTFHCSLGSDFVL